MHISSPFMRACASPPSSPEVVARGSSPRPCRTGRILIWIGRATSLRSGNSPFRRTLEVRLVSCERACEHGQGSAVSVTGRLPPHHIVVRRPHDRYIKDEHVAHVVGEADIEDRERGVGPDRPNGPLKCRLTSI